MKKRIALIGKNSIQYIEIVLKIWEQGDSAVLIDWKTPFNIIKKILEDVNCCLCYFDSSISIQKNELTHNRIQVVPYDAQIEKEELVPQQITEKYKPNYSKDEAVIIYSSGTTGKAKGIVLSHYAINTNADAIIEYMNPTSIDCIYLVKTLSHSSTFIGELLVALKSKMNLLVSPTIISPKYIFGNIIKYNVSILCLNPTLLRLYTTEFQKHTYEIATLKKIYVSGDILHYSDKSAAQKVFPFVDIYNVYGLTEAGPRVTAQTPYHHHCSSVGCPVKGVEIQIRDQNMLPLKQGEKGIVWVKTPSLFTNYIAGEKEYVNVVNDWLNTGDIGVLDVYNELHILGRLDDMIIINAHKIYPTDIENCILKYCDVDNCAVVSVLYNNEYYLGCLYEAKHERSNFVNKLSKFLLPHEIPKLYIKGQIPKTSTGKINRVATKDFISNKLLN